MTFIGTLNAIAREAVLQHYLKTDQLYGFDIAKAIAYIDRLCADEIKFLEKYPDEYLLIYGEEKDSDETG
jgi:hypothetical protein